MGHSAKKIEIATDPSCRSLGSSDNLLLILIVNGANGARCYECFYLQVILIVVLGDLGSSPSGLESEELIQSMFLVALSQQKINASQQLPINGKSSATIAGKGKWEKKTAIRYRDARPRDQQSTSEVLVKHGAVRM